MTKGKIVRLATFGAFVELSEGIEGLCHVSELDDKRIEDPEEHFSVGQELDFKIIKMNLLERKIGLSLKALKEGAEKESVWGYTQEVGTASIGDIAGEQLGQLRKKAEEAEGEEDDES